jgi:hypothetical protein
MGRDMGTVLSIDMGRHLSRHHRSFLQETFALTLCLFPWGAERHPDSVHAFIFCGSFFRNRTNATPTPFLYISPGRQEQARTGIDNCIDMTIDKAGDMGTHVVQAYC